MRNEPYVPQEIPAASKRLAQQIEAIRKQAEKAEVPRRKKRGVFARLLAWFS